MKKIIFRFRNIFLPKLLQFKMKASFNNNNFLLLKENKPLLNNFKNKFDWNLLPVGASPRKPRSAFFHLERESTDRRDEPAPKSSWSETFLNRSNFLIPVSNPKMKSKFLAAKIVADVGQSRRQPFRIGQTRTGKKFEPNKLTKLNFRN